MNNPQTSTNDGCKKFTNGNCQECQQGYLFSRDRKCLKITDNCRIINLETGIC